MHYSLSLPTVSPWPVVSISPRRPDRHDDPLARRDPRWRSLVTRLKALRERGRRAVRIVDLNCGDGALLIQAVKQARTLGFLSIEGVGVDRDPRHIDEAHRLARLAADSAIGLDFRVADPATQLELEAEFPADIILYAASGRTTKAFRDAVKRAGDYALRAHPAARTPKA